MIYARTGGKRMSMTKTKRTSERFWKAKSGRTLKLSMRLPARRLSRMSRQPDCVRLSINFFYCISQQGQQFNKEEQLSQRTHSDSKLVRAESNKFAIGAPLGKCKGDVSFQAKIKGSKCSLSRLLSWDLKDVRVFVDSKTSFRCWQLVVRARSPMWIRIE